MLRPARFPQPLFLFLGLLFLSALTNLIACHGLPLKEEPDYGTTLVSLKVKPEDLGLLNSQVQSKRPVQAQVKIPGRLSANCLIASAGRSSLDDYRKSLQINDCDALLYERHGFRLSAQSVDGSLLRSRLGYPIFQFLQLEVPKYESASTYLNKNFLGLYLLIETIDKEFFENRGFRVKDIYKARYGNASFSEDFLARLPEAFSYEGSPDDFTLLRRVYEAVLQPGDDQEFDLEIQRWLDVDSFLRYAAAALFTCHWDGMSNNYYLVLDTRKKKLFVVPWDLDRIWERTDSMEPAEIVELNRLLKRLLQIPAHRQRFQELLALLELNFPQHKLEEELQKIGAETAKAYAADPVLGRLKQEMVLAEFVDRIGTWFGKIRVYRQNF